MEELSQETIIQKLLEEKSYLIKQLKEIHEEFNQSQNKYFSDREKYNTLYNTQQEAIKHLKENEVVYLLKLESLSKEIAKLQIENALKEGVQNDSFHIPEGFAVDGLLQLIPDNKKLEAIVLLQELMKFNENEHVLFVKYLKEELDNDGIDVFSNEEVKIRIKDAVNKIQEDAIAELKRCDEVISKKNEMIELLKEENQELENLVNIKESEHSKEDYKIHLPFKQGIIRENEELTEKLANLQIEMEELKRKKIEELSGSIKTGEWDEMKRKVEESVNIQQENQQLKLKLENLKLFEESQRNIEISGMKRQNEVISELNEEKQKEIERLRKENEELRSNESKLSSEMALIQNHSVNIKQENEKWKVMCKKLQSDIDVVTISKVTLENEIQSLKAENVSAKEKIKAFEGGYDELTNCRNIIKENEDTIDLLKIENGCLKKRVSCLEDESNEHLKKQNELITTIWKNKEKVMYVDQVTEELQKKIGQTLFDLKKEEEKRKEIEQIEKQEKEEIAKLKEGIEKKEDEWKTKEKEMKDEIQREMSEKMKEQEEILKKEQEIIKLESTLKEFESLKQEKEEKERMLFEIGDEIKKIDIDINEDRDIVVGVKAVITAQRVFEEKQKDVKEKESIFKKQIKEQNISLEKLEGIIERIVNNEGIDETSKNIILYLQEENGRLQRLVKLNEKGVTPRDSEEEKEKLRIEADGLKMRIEVEKKEKEEWKKRIQDVYTKKDIVAKSQYDEIIQKINEKDILIDSLTCEQKEKERQYKETEERMKKQIEEEQKVKEQTKKEKEETVKKMEEEFNGKTRKFEEEKEKMKLELEKCREELKKSKIDEPLKGKRVEPGFMGRLQPSKHTSGDKKESYKPIVGKNTLDTPIIPNPIEVEKKDAISATPFEKLKETKIIEESPKKSVGEQQSDLTGENEDDIDESDENDENEMSGEEESSESVDNVVDNKPKFDPFSITVAANPLSSVNPESPWSKLSGTTKTQDTLPKLNFGEKIHSEPPNLFGSVKSDVQPPAKSSNPLDSLSFLLDKTSKEEKQNKLVESIGLKNEELFDFGGSATSSDEKVFGALKLATEKKDTFEVGACQRVKPLQIPTNLPKPDKDKTKTSGDISIEQLKKNSKLNQRSGLNLAGFFLNE